MENVIINTCEIDIFRESWDFNIFDVNIFQENFITKRNKKTI